VAYLRYDGVFEGIKIVSQNQPAVGLPRIPQRVVDPPLKAVAFFSKQCAMTDKQRAEGSSHHSAFSDLQIVEPAAVRWQDQTIDCRRG